jgi:hypothetical protein
MYPELILWALLEQDNDMKKILLLIIPFFVSNYCISNDTVYVEGLFIRKYLKSEILFKMENEFLKQQEKSYQQMIDYKVWSFFCTLKIDSTIILMNENEIEPMICANQNYKNVEIYQFPKFPYIFSKDCQYYINSKDTNYVYKIYNIKGKALRFEVRNDYLNQLRNIELEVHWHIDSYSVNKNIPYFYLYSFLDIDIVDCSFSVAGFDIWTKKT